MLIESSPPAPYGAMHPTVLSFIWVAKGVSTTDDTGA